MSEEDQLIYDFLLEIKDTKLRRKVESDKLTQADKKLVEAGQEIVRKALSRLPTKSASSPPSKKRKTVDNGEWSDWISQMNSEMAEEQKMKSEELEI